MSNEIYYFAVISMYFSIEPLSVFTISRGQHKSHLLIEKSALHTLNKYTVAVSTGLIY